MPTTSARLMMAAGMHPPENLNFGIFRLAADTKVHESTRIRTAVPAAQNLVWTICWAWRKHEWFLGAVNLNQHMWIAPAEWPRPAAEAFGRVYIPSPFEVAHVTWQTPGVSWTKALPPDSRTVVAWWLVGFPAHRLEELFGPIIPHLCLAARTLMASPAFGPWALGEDLSPIPEGRVVTNSAYYRYLISTPWPKRPIKRHLPPSTIVWPTWEAKEAWLLSMPKVLRRREMLRDSQRASQRRNTSSTWLTNTLMKLPPDDSAQARPRH